MRALQLEAISSCPNCGSLNVRPWRCGCRDWQRPTAVDTFTLEVCERCRVRFLRERPILAELPRIYHPGYGPHAMASDGTAPSSNVVVRLAALPLRIAGLGLAFAPRRRLASLLERAYTPGERSAKLLDFGCGAPTFLDDARRRGWGTVGVDAAPDVVALVRERGHEAFLAGREFERGVSDDSVHCVRMNHVIEHLYEPRTVLSHLKSKLVKGGRIHLATPNPEGLGARLFGRYWLGLDPPRHVTLYPPAVLGRLLEEIGFRVDAVVHEPAAKDLARSWGIFRWSHLRMEPERIQSLVQSPAHLGAFAPLAGASALAGMADRYHVIACK